MYEIFLIVFSRRENWPKVYFLKVIADTTVVLTSMFYIPLVTWTL